MANTEHGMATSHSRAAQQARLAKRSQSMGKKPCKFCQRSRWLMVMTILIVLASVSVLNRAG